MGKGFGGLVQGKNCIDDRLQFSGGGPFERGLDVGAISPIAADEALLLHEEWPKVDGHLTSGGGPARHHRSPARQTIKNFLQHFAAHMFHDQIHATLACDAAHFRRPLGICGIDHELRAKALSQISFRFRGTGADDARA